MSVIDVLKIGKARADLFEGITKLMEEAYNLGYADGREDAETKHKSHVMNVLKNEMEKH